MNNDKKGIFPKAYKLYKARYHNQKAKIIDLWQACLLDLNVHSMGNDNQKHRQHYNIIMMKKTYAQIFSFSFLRFPPNNDEVNANNLQLHNSSLHLIPHVTNCTI